MKLLLATLALAWTTAHAQFQVGLKPGFFPRQASAVVSVPFITGQTAGTPQSGAGSDNVGFLFRVGSAALTVTDVGVFRQSGDNNTSISAHISSVTGGTLYATATIDLTAGSAGSFVYAPVTPVVLSANTTYVATFRDTGKWYDSNSTITHTADATVPNATYSANPISGITDFNANANGGTDHAYGFVNFKYHL